jgi:ribose transport system substrate-binding protein
MSMDKRIQFRSGLRGWARKIGVSMLALLSMTGVAAAAEGKVGVDLPMLASPFWQAYNNYIPIYAKQLGLQIFQPVNSNYDTATQITDVNNLLNLGAAGIVLTPIESAAVHPVLRMAASKNVPVVAVDVAPTHGPVAIVVRADNRAYGEKACLFLGQHVSSGAVVQIMGDLASVNGRDRAEAFRDCMKSYPKLQVLEIPADWKADVAAAALDGLLTAHPDIHGIYMHAGGAFLAATLQTLKRKNLLVPAGQPGHIVIVSNDGIPQEYEAIRKGEIDATVSQPADLYAKYGLLYLKEAMAGQTFKVGPTDHGSTIVEVSPGVLEDELPAPLVTKANVDDKSLWGNQL